MTIKAIVYFLIDQCVFPALKKRRDSSFRVVLDLVQSTRSTFPKLTTITPPLYGYIRQNLTERKLARATSIPTGTTGQRTPLLSVELGTLYPFASHSSWWTLFCAIDKYDPTYWADAPDPRLRHKCLGSRRFPARHMSSLLFVAMQLSRREVLSAYTL